MNADELMLGDWVLCTSVDKPARVESITPLEGLGSAGYTFGLRDADNHLYLVHKTSVRPIPITMDIMGKNFSNSPEWAFLGNTRVYFRFYFDKNLCHIRNSGKRYVGRIDNVHELQHVLRDCGLKELATDFKV